MNRQKIERRILWLSIAKAACDAVIGLGLIGAGVMILYGVIHLQG